MCQLVKQKNDILAVLNSGLNYDGLFPVITELGQIETATDMLSLVAKKWIDNRYGYKGEEISQKLIEAFENTYYKGGATSRIASIWSEAIALHKRFRDNPL